MQRLPQDQFAALVRDHHAAVHRSAARWVGADGAADVTQDVFLRVLEGKLRLGAAHSVRATLCWLATRLAANHQRSRSRRSRHEEHAMQPDTWTDPTHDPAARAADASLRQAVAEQLEALPPELRLPVQLHCQDEVTLAAIGAELRLPTSTVHDRVQQGLRRLRTALADRGFALALTGLPEVVAALPVRAPGGLQDRLLALGETAAAGATGAAGFGGRLALGVAAAVTTVAVAMLAWWPAPHAPVPVERGVAAAATSAQAPPGGSAGDRAAVPAPERTFAAAAPAAGPVEGLDLRPRTTSVFHGTVLDAGAWPVAGATVQAVAAGGLKPFELGHTTIDAQGAFRLELGPLTLYPDAVRLRVVEAGHLLLETGELALPRAADAEPLALVLAAAAGTALSRYELTVAVVGPDGTPLPGVPVTLKADATPPPRADGYAGEAEASTGGDGIAVLRGRSLGAKWLFVDGRPAGLASQFVAVPLERAGAHHRRIGLLPGGRLEVRLGTVDGAPPGPANVWLEDAGNGLQHTGTLAADGVVVFTGLAAGEHTLHVDAANMSPVARSGLRPDGVPVEVRLKHREDLRDLGDHMAELHGELVDAATGQPVEWGAFAIDVLPLREGASTLPSDRLVPRGPSQQFDGGGRFVAFHEVGLAAGRQALVADVPGYARSVVEFELRAGELRTGVRVPLQRGGELRGRVLDAAGQPVAGAQVGLVGSGELADRILAGWRRRANGDDDRGPMPSLPCASAWTDGAGSFVLAAVPSGVEFRVFARQREGGFAVLPARLVRAGEVVTGLELRLARP